MASRMKRAAVVTGRSNLRSRENPKIVPLNGRGGAKTGIAAADNRDLEVDRLQAWGDFATTHPNVAKALAYNPSLMNSDGYLAKHPDLEAFLQTHPDVEKSMAANPGNYNAIPPRPGE